MSYFSAALQRALDDLSWSQQDLIGVTGIHRTSMSGYVRGSIPVGANTFRRLCRAFPESSLPPLLQAWLLDRVPRSMRHMVDVVTRTGEVREEQPLELVCTEEVRRSLEVLARRSIEAPVRDLILDLAKVLTMDGETEE